MANLIQLKRASDWNTSEDPGAATLAEGELAWNNKGKKLWMGRKIATTGTTHELYRVDKSVLGTTNQISVSEGAESFTVSLPGQVNLSDLTVAGTLTVNGTTTTVNSTVVTVDDPIFTLGGDGDGVDDDKDRGIEFKWHNGSAAKKGFFGRNDNTGRFAYIADATNSSEVFSGALGDAEFTTVYANLTGNVTGNCSGNAGTVTNGLYTNSTIDGGTF